MNARIIPACAGSTRCAPSSRRPARDHPRMRGEHLAVGKDQVSLEGSSPHARGARVRPVHRGVHRGIIPACAGSTQAGAIGGPDVGGSSPHARGALRLGRWPRPAQVGSSPHARGAPYVSSPGICYSRDHPRMRGEHAMLPCDGGAMWGIIPACAGSTLHDQRVWSTFSPNTFTFCKL